MKNSRRRESPIPSPESANPVLERVERRVAKYQAKTTPERMSALFASKAERMRERYRSQALVQECVDQAVAGVTDAEGVSVMMRICYKSYGREICRVWRTVPSGSQEVEYEAVRYKWNIRGLNPDILGKVKAAVVEMLEAAGFPRKDDEPLT